MNLDYVVVTSVDRDELPDQGAAHFAECISEIRKQNPKTLIEVLTPDFRGNEKCIQTVLEAKPTVFAHNLETVKRLQSSVRDFRAGYEQSLGVLKFAKQAGARFTKSSLMLGLGEEREEVLQAMEDLRNAGVDILTLGQYLRPSQNHLLVARYVTPAEFKDYEKEGLKRGFAFVAAGPFVRSSYRAGELFVKNIEFKRS
jgi:lipoic acid synthetase